MNSRLTQFFLKSFLILIGVSIVTILLSVRSWYKPNIGLGQVSPMTITLEKDVEVVDIVKTNENKEKAKQKAIQNPRNKRILQVNNDSTKESIEKLDFLIKLCRKELPENIVEANLINIKVSFDTQQSLIEMGDDSWSEFKVLMDKESEEHGKSSEYASYFDELDKLLEVEKNKFIEAIDSFRKEEKLIAQEKEALGRSFFNNLKQTNAEEIFANAIIIQKKLLDLGIVSGLSRDKIKQNIQILFPNLSRSKLALIQPLIDRSTYPNVRIDWVKLHEVEEEAMEKVPDVTTMLKAGTVLARKGEKIEETNYYYLEQLDMLHPQANWKQIFDNFLIISSSIAFFALIFFLARVKKFTMQEIAMMIIVSAGLAAVIAFISLWGINKLAMTPLASLSMLLTVFYAPIMAGVSSTLMAFFLLESFDLNIWQVLPLYVGSIYAIFLAHKAHQREDLTKAGTKIAIVQAIVFGLTIIVAVGNFQVSTVLILAALYAVSGILSGFITLAVLPYLESSLRLLTPFKLLELSNPNQPLLRKLKEDAPGTYQHSIQVSHLAEEACRAVGGNVELVRIGILYHDVGKTYKADYFIENQMGKPNPHTTLDDPLQSAKIILDHIPEGIKLCKKYNLPQAIIDYVPMHQGTTVTNYFYHKGIEKFGKENVNPDDYRYPGPKPNTKETGIAMLADTIEAALTSIKGTADKEDAMNMINKLTMARLKEGELDNSTLTREELDKVCEAFFKVWKRQNHQRVKYPDQEKESKN